MKYLNERGYALYFTLITIVLISVLFLSLLTVNTNANKTTINERADQSLFYVAEAGINLEKAKIHETIEQLYANLQSKINSYIDPDEQLDFLSTYGGLEGYYTYLVEHNYCSTYNTITGINGKCADKTYSNSFNLQNQLSKIPVADTVVKYECATKNCIFTISSKGTFSSETRSRNLEQHLEIKLPSYTGGSASDPDDSNTPPPSSPLTEYAAFTKGNITLTGSSTLHGNAGLLNGSISLDGGSRVNGNVSVSDPSKFIYPSWMGNFDNQLVPHLTMDVDALLPEYPSAEAARLANLPLPANLEVAASEWNKTNIINNGDFLANNWMTNGYKYNLQNDTRFKNFIVDQNNTITLNIGNNNINLYVDDFNIKQGHIKLQGTGTLNIYVKNSINIKGSFNDQPNKNPAQLNIFYEGSSPNTFTGETQFYGSYFSKSANLTLTGGAGFYGNIYSGGNNITIKGGVPTNGQYIVAPKATLKLEQGGHIKGTVIADKIIGSGGTTITFGNPIIPLPTLPKTPPINIPDTDEYLKEKPIKEL